MEKYRIEVVEVLSRIVEIDAESKEMAIEAIKLKYRNSYIVLDASDHIRTEISAK